MKIIILILSLTGLILLLFFLFSNNSSNSNFTKVENQVTQPKRPVIFLMIDSLMDEPLQKAMKEKQVPALEFLIQNGQYYPNVVSSYPTMSVTIDSTLLTGTYPDHHNIPGLVWYDEKEKRIVNYGSGKKKLLLLVPNRF